MKVEIENWTRAPPDKKHLQDILGRFRCRTCQENCDDICDPNKYKCRNDVECEEIIYTAIDEQLQQCTLLKQPTTMFASMWKTVAKQTGFQPVDEDTCSDVTNICQEMYTHNPLKLRDQCKRRVQTIGALCERCTDNTIDNTFFCQFCNATPTANILSSIRPIQTTKRIGEEYLPSELCTHVFSIIFLNLVSIYIGMSPSSIVTIIKNRWMTSETDIDQDVLHTLATKRTISDASIEMLSMILKDGDDGSIFWKHVSNNQSKIKKLHHSEIYTHIIQVYFLKGHRRLTNKNDTISFLIGEITYGSLEKTCEQILSLDTSINWNNVSELLDILKANDHVYKLGLQKMNSSMQYYGIELQL